MKINKFAAALLALLLCLMASGALAAEFTLIGEYDVASAVTVDSDIENLVFPAKIKYAETNEYLQVRKSRQISAH